jgi:hypothetical protein
MQTLLKTRKLFLAVGLLAAAMLLPAAAALGRGQPAALPDRVTNAPELGAVMWSGAHKAFVQVQFDRGIIKAIDRDTRTITILQKQAGQVWRTQTFTIPKGTDIFVAGRDKSFRSLRIGMHVRIEQTAVLGAALAVVRVDARTNRDEALPPTTAAGAPLTGGTASGGSAANGNGGHPRFLPARFSNAPELTAIVFSGASNAFIERQFDRGKVTAVSAGSITILQRQAGHVWRTQTFAIPASAKILVEASAGELAKVKVGMHVRIEQSGPVGGPLSVVEVDSQRANKDIDFPTSSG